MKLIGHKLKLQAFILLAAGCLCCSCQGQRGVLKVAHLCDPQLGFGTDGFGADSARFEQAIRQINALSPDAVVIAGDMVNDIGNEQAVKTVTALIAKIRPPVVLTAGNHDLPDPVTAEGLERYRSIFGNDFQVMECKGRCLISANSQLWREAPRKEKDDHQRKLHESLQLAKRKGQPVILVTHVPLYVASPDEPDEYFNLPASLRGDLLRLCEENGVFVWLAGHIHKTAQRTCGAITLLNGETTSRNFDNRPAGFRWLTVYPDNRFEWEFIALTQE
jgi:DNA repair exonuclease SbcCD nuclease subunit